MIVRILLLLAMAPLAWQTIHRYAFAYQEGYPLWPLIALSGCFWAYLQLRPEQKTNHQTHYNVDSVLLLLFAVVGSAFVLNLRGEKTFEPIWYLHMATLTFFQLLIPYLAAHRFTRAHGAVTATVALLLLGLLLKGTTDANASNRLEIESIRETGLNFAPNERRG